MHGADTTINIFGTDEDGYRDTFIITGDIEAMWFRDSTNQVKTPPASLRSRGHGATRCCFLVLALGWPLSLQVAPYWRYVNEDPGLKELMCGLVNRQVRNVLYDPYANAFNPNNEGTHLAWPYCTSLSPALTCQVDPSTTAFTLAGGPWQEDSREPPMTDHLHEGKYELDSLAAVLKLSNNYYDYVGDMSCLRPDWIDAMNLIIDTVIDQQISTFIGHHARDDDTSPAHHVEYAARFASAAPTQAVRMTGRTRTTGSTGAPRLPRTRL